MTNKMDDKIGLMYYNYQDSRVINWFNNKRSNFNLKDVQREFWSQKSV